MEKYKEAINILKKYNQKHIIKLLEMLDNNVGKVIEVLKETGLYDNTLIILTSDHGIAFPKCKCTLFDKGTKVSLIIRYPNFGHGKKIESLMSHVDVVPTICDYLNLKTNYKFQGQNKLDLLNQEKDSLIVSEINCHTSYEPCRSIRSDRYKYIKYYDDSYPYVNLSNIDNSISKDDYINKLNNNKNMEMFYDLDKDPLEKENLIDKDEYKEIVAQYKKYLIDWQNETNDYLLEGQLKFLNHWKINKSECVNPKSKNNDDYLIIK